MDPAEQVVEAVLDDNLLAFDKTAEETPRRSLFKKATAAALVRDLREEAPAERAALAVNAAAREAPLRPEMEAEMYARYAILARRLFGSK